MMNQKGLVFLLWIFSTIVLCGQGVGNSPVLYFDPGAPSPALADDNGGWDVNHWIAAPDAAPETRNVWTQGAIAIFDLTGVGDFTLNVSYPLSGSSEAFYAADIGGVVFIPPANRTAPYNINASGGGLMNFLAGTVIDIGDGSVSNDFAFRNQRVGNGTPFRITGSMTKRGLGTLNIAQIGGADFRSMSIEANIVIEEGTIRVDNANRNPDSVVDLSMASILVAEEGELLLASSRPYNSPIGSLGGDGTISMARSGNGDAFSFEGFFPGGVDSTGSLLVRSVGPESQAISFTDDALLSFDLGTPENTDRINFEVTFQSLTIDFSTLTFDSFAFNPHIGFGLGEYILMRLDVGAGNDITAVGFPEELTGMIGDFKASITLGNIENGTQDIILSVTEEDNQTPCNPFSDLEEWVFFDGSINEVAFGWGWVAPDGEGWTYSLAFGWIFPTCNTQWMYQSSKEGPRWIWVLDTFARNGNSIGVWFVSTDALGWQFIAL